MVCDKDMTSDIGREFEFPNTPIAIRKLRGRFLKPRALPTRYEQRNDTRVWTTKMTGMMASSTSLSGVNWEASLLKTLRDQLHRTQRERKSDLLRHGVKSMTLRLAANFCISASNMPCLATMYPGAETTTTSRMASHTSRTKRGSAG